MRRLALLLSTGLMTGLAPAYADEAQVEAVTFASGSSGWTVSVTLRHADTGWEDYADGWRVEAEDGTVLGTRPLAHPHVNEQPFTRSLRGVKIPEGTAQVYIRARTLTEGWGAERTMAKLPD